MPRRFLTERDINDYVAQGVKELVLEPGTVVTDLGQERARAAGLRLVQESCGAPPASGAPLKAGAPEEMQSKVRAAVVARLGEVPEGLDTIIARVLRALQ